VTDLISGYRLEG
jgi:cell division control protein 7